MMDFSNVNVCVVLPAAGSGERLGSCKPKQYCLVLGKPLICYAIEAFERIPWVNKVVVVAAPQYLELMREIVECNGYGECEVVSGGPTRHRSIALGLKSLSFAGDSNPDQIVVIHDGVRPLVPLDVVEEVVLSAKKYGAAGAVRQLVSTVVSADESGFLDQSLERCRYRASEMPQAFQYHVIKTAYEKCTEYDLDHGTECLHLALKYAGVRAKLVEGTADLWKVTHKRDVNTAEIALRELTNRILIVSDNVQSSLIETMQMILAERFSKVDVCDSKIREPGDFADYNNTVFVHFDKTIEELVKSRDKTDRSDVTISPLPESATEIRGVVVHIFTYTKEPVPNLQGYPDAFIWANEIADRRPKPFTVVHTIWNIVQITPDVSKKKITKIVSELVEKKNSSLHGQLLIV